MADPTIEELWSAFWSWADAHPSGAYLFRGQADNSPIVPKIGRAAYSYNRSREVALFDAFERAAHPYLKSDLSRFELLALAQHHGCPTRLTDWSTSPMVAAWFAVSSYPENKEAEVYALDVTRDDLDTVDVKTFKTGSGPTLPDPLAPQKGVYLVETAQVSNRITTQRGIFTLHGDPTAPLAIGKGETFPIPAALRADFQNRLMDLGFDASHIYPDLDGLCKSLDWRLKAGKALSAFA